MGNGQWEEEEERGRGGCVSCLSRMGADSFAPPGQLGDWNDSVPRVARCSEQHRFTRGYIPAPRWGEEGRCAGSNMDVSSWVSSTPSAWRVVVWDYRGCRRKASSTPRLLTISPSGCEEGNGEKAMGHREERSCAVLFGAALWGRGSHRTLEACENALAGKSKLLL
jgi:hypothetical protein